MPTLSVIIPVLNEAAYLPRLLDALHIQTQAPDEIIVADAGSTDGSVELAQSHLAIVIPGGMPGPGRNAGARVAIGDIFLFLDADVLPHPDFMACAIDEFDKEQYAVATCPMEALDGDLADQILLQATNLYMQVVEPISPRAPGFCIFARREVHKAIGGFDETLKMSEDHDYVRRAAQIGKFGMLNHVRIPVSMRRIEEEGLASLALKYLWCEMYALAGKPVRSMPFEYTFGAHQPFSASSSRTLVDIGELRRQLGRFENPIHRLSIRRLDALRGFLEIDPLEATHERFKRLFELQDLNALDHYLKQRLELIPHPESFQERWTKLKTLPKESIRLLETELLHRSKNQDEHKP